MLPIYTSNAMAMNEFRKLDLEDQTMVLLKALYLVAPTTEAALDAIVKTMGIKIRRQS